MIRCSQCKTTNARIITGSELTKLSKKLYAGAVVAAAATVAKSATTSASGAAGLIAKVSKAASKAPGGPLTKLGMIAAGAVITGLVKLGIEQWSNGNAKYVYCANCGHQEPLKKGG